MTKPEPIAVWSDVDACVNIESHDPIIDCNVIDAQIDASPDDVLAINRAHYLAVAKVLRDMAENQDDACCVGMRGFLRTRAAEFEEAGK